MGVDVVMERAHNKKNGATSSKLLGRKTIRVGGRPQPLSPLGYAFHSKNNYLENNYSICF
jgi:hypothetical protein